MPMIGSIDSMRAQVMSTMLQAIERSQAKMFMLDIHWGSHHRYCGR